MNLQPFVLIFALILSSCSEVEHISRPESYRKELKRLSKRKAKREVASLNIDCKELLEIITERSIPQRKANFHKALRSVHPSSEAKRIKDKHSNMANILNNAGYDLRPH